MIGINSVDLFKMPPLKSNRISYIRQKTDKERASNVRRIEFTLQPEAEEIIKKYAGKNYMLDVMDTYNNHVDFTHRMNLGLQKMGELKRVGRGGKKIITPAFPGITSYWARHTWATLAAELEIPKETIGAALGHAGTSVTDIYINFDKKKIDEANRKVIDFILQKN
jgi:integrase